jgi:hypothetical protein
VRKQTSGPAKRGSGEARSLAPSDYPGYEIFPGDAIYTSYDSLGHPVTGTQRFTLRVIFAFTQLGVETMRIMRSDYVSAIEAFFSGGYTMPASLPGDAARIDGVQIVKIEPGILDKTATRAVISVEAEYYFTLF